jgi:hypothetical protein
MKTKYILLFVLAIVLSACTKNFEDFNTDQKNPAVVSGEALFSNAQKALADQITTANVNLNIWRLWAQYWTETTYTDEANYDIVNRTIADLTFRTYYRDILQDMETAKKIIADEETNALNDETDISNKLYIIDLMEVYCFQNLVDIFGDIPYTEALDINNLLPVYDDAATIYADLIARTSAAIGGLAASDNAGFGTADLIYGGSVDAWKAFGNSLKIKLGITIADANASLAESTIESAVDGAFASADDNAMFPYQGSPPNTNQIYAELILTGRKDFVAANTIVDIMNALGDPRLASYFELVDTSSEAGVPKLVYLGGLYGESSPWSQYSHVANAILDPAFPGAIMTYDEVLFYLAEAAQRGFDVGGTAEELYNAAITASFDFWGAAGVDDYLLNPDVAYSGAEWKDRIGVQSWLAFYNRGLEGYTQWRRLDAPAFNIAPAIADASEIPLRFTYPINEQTLNPDNYYTAAEAIGGDELTTHIFWDTE